jgi:hypothetical protein
MRGDFTRLSTDSGKYSAVLLQQGRILVDADWNTAAGTSLWAQRALAADIVGPHGGPNSHLGFTPTLGDSDGHSDLELSPGVYYVDGIRCELPAALVPPGHDAMPWNDQPYPIALAPVDLPNLPYLVYLDVWERLVTALDDDALLDVAAPGSDTTRRQVVWQVRVMPYPSDGAEPTGDTFPLDEWRTSLRGAPARLRATTTSGAGIQDEFAAPDGGFTGAENHLYRVEIAATGTGGDPALFIWSRDNGSVAARWTATQGDRLYIAGSEDAPQRFSAGDWVELTWDAVEFAGAPTTRVRVAAVDRAVLTVDPATASGRVEPDPASRVHAKVRRWDQRGTATTRLVAGAVEVTARSTGWIPLEDGIVVEFDSGDTEHAFRVGDYWTFPARTAAADVDWPRDPNGEPLFQPPQGPSHHYAPLAYVGAGRLVCLQKTFPPLATSCP